MKHRQTKRSRAASIFSGKGFYISLVVCLLAIGVTAFFAVSRTGDILNGAETMDLSSAVVSANEWGFPQNANAAESGLEVTSSEEQTSQSGSSESSASSKKQSGSEKQKSSSDSSQTAFAMPISGKIMQEYSNGELVKSSVMNDWRTHDGVDIAGNVTDPVKAAADGTVTDIIDDALWGVVIEIDHGNGYVGRYCGLNTTVSVKKNQEVTMGDVIGCIGETSLYETNDDPHLHFELLKDDEYVDPMSVIKG